MQLKIQKNVLLILQLATFAVFAGRAYQHLFWDAPYRTLLWDQDLLEGIITSVFNISWYQYATSATTDYFIQLLIRSTGFVYIICALIAITGIYKKKIAGKFLLFGSALLIMLSLLYWKEKFYNVGQFFEYSAQFMSPILLYLYYFKKLSFKKFTLILKISIALTFICHGLYAIGYYPQPGYFVDMTIKTLHLSEAYARQLLIIFGILDFIIAIGIFIPSIAIPSLIYACIWGFLTSLARIVGNFYIDFPLMSLHQWTHEFILRLPHALLPLALIIILKERIVSFLIYLRNNRVFITRKFFKIKPATS